MNESESSNCHPSLPLVSSAIVVAPSSESNNVFQPHHHINREISNDIENVSDGDVDDMNLEDIVKHQEKMEQSIPSSGKLISLNKREKINIYVRKSLLVRLINVT